MGFDLFEMTKMKNKYTDFWSITCDFTARQPNQNYVRTKNNNGKNVEIHRRTYATRNELWLMKYFDLCRIGGIHTATLFDSSAHSLSSLCEALNGANDDFVPTFASVVRTGVCLRFYQFTQYLFAMKFMFGRPQPIETNKK